MTQQLHESESSFLSSNISDPKCEEVERKSSFFPYSLWKQKKFGSIFFPILSVIYMKITMKTVHRNMTSPMISSSAHVITAMQYYYSTNAFADSLCQNFD